MKNLRRFFPWLLALVLSLAINLGTDLAYANHAYYVTPVGYVPVKHHKHKKNYRYYYYPTSQVYYSPFNGRYYYLNNGYWSYAPVLPPNIRLGPSVSINLGGPVPYYYHPTVVSRYPVYYY
jgi:hypothetical protein